MDDFEDGEEVGEGEREIFDDVGVGFDVETSRGSFCHPFHELFSC